MRMGPLVSQGVLAHETGDLRGPPDAANNRCWKAKAPSRTEAIHDIKPRLSED